MFTLTSTSYKDKEPIPLKHVYRSLGGKNISPAFQWEDPPVNTKSFAFSIVDPHPVAKNWVHWLVINIPLRERKLPEGVSGKNMPTGAKELLNSYGDTGYGGPEPPRGSGSHPYIATIYALNTDMLSLPKETSLRQFQNAIEGKIIAERSMTGFYEQK